MTPERRARRAVALAFLANGVLFGTLAARVPAIKDRLDLSDGELGLALVMLPAGTICAFPLVGRAIAARGSRPVMQAGLVLTAVAIALVGAAPSIVTLGGAAFVLGAVNAAEDVAMNAHGVAVEGRIGRPILSSLHAAWSIGGLVGAAVGGLLAEAGLDVRVHLALVPALACAGALAASGGLLASAADATAPARMLRRPPRRLVLVGLIAFCCLFAEGAATDWSAVYLDDALGASPGVAAAAFAAYSLTMAAGRLAGDRLVVRWGPTGLIARSGTLAAAGLGMALLVGHPVAGIVGFAILGAGVAPVVPVAFRAGGAEPGVPAGQGIALVGVVGYTGFVAGPAAIGLTADAAGLPAALGIVVAMLAAVVALAPNAAGGRTTRRAVAHAA